MKYLIIFFIVTICFQLPAICQSEEFKPFFSTAIDFINGKALLHQCSRATPENISFCWPVTQKDIDNLENNFSKITALTSIQCCGEGKKIKSLRSFCCQYIGVVINKSKYIYINAFSLSTMEALTEQNAQFDFSKDPVNDICGGGIYLWGVLFDIKTKEFSELCFNAPK